MCGAIVSGSDRHSSGGRFVPVADPVLLFVLPNEFDVLFRFRLGAECGQLYIDCGRRGQFGRRSGRRLVVVVVIIVAGCIIRRCPDGSQVSLCGFPLLRVQRLSGRYDYSAGFELIAATGVDWCFKRLTGNDQLSLRSGYRTKQIAGACGLPGRTGRRKKSICCGDCHPTGVTGTGTARQVSDDFRFLYDLVQGRSKGGKKGYDLNILGVKLHIPS